MSEHEWTELDELAERLILALADMDPPYGGSAGYGSNLARVFSELWHFRMSDQLGDWRVGWTAGEARRRLKAALADYFSGKVRVQIWTDAPAGRDDE